jgi:uncharacterized membrane protein YeiH
LPITGYFTLPIELELAAVFLLAITGALLAMEERYDVIGVFVLALVTAIGGGLVRDAFFLPKGPPLMLQDERYLLVVAVAVVFCLIVGTYLTRAHVVFLLVDALGLGIYAVVGTQHGLEFGLHVVPASFVGLANAVGGGLLRDVVTRKEPLLLRPGEFYVLAAVVGIAVFNGAAYLGGLPAPRAALWSIAATFLIRLAAVWFNLRTVEARPLLGSRGSRTPS